MTLEDEVVHLRVEIDRLKYTITVLKECADAKDGRIAELEMRVEGQDLHAQGQNDAIARRDEEIRKLLREVDHWEIRWRNENENLDRVTAHFKKVNDELRKRKEPK